jgi:sec-independent protein translocase protein TatB
MFDIGFSELLIIAVVALVVLGPERLPKAARFAGLWLRRARVQWNSVKDELERELAAEEFKRNLSQVHDAVRDNGETMQREMEQTRKMLLETAKEIAEPAPYDDAPPDADETSPQTDLFAAPEKQQTP